MTDFFDVVRKSKIYNDRAAMLDEHPLVPEVTHVAHMVAQADWLISKSRIRPDDPACLEAKNLGDKILKFVRKNYAVMFDFYATFDKSRKIIEELEKRTDMRFDWPLQPEEIVPFADRIELGARMLAD